MVTKFGNTEVRFKLVNGANVRSEVGWSVTNREIVSFRPCVRTRGLLVHNFYSELPGKIRGVGSFPFCLSPICALSILPFGFVARFLSHVMAIRKHQTLVKKDATQIYKVRHLELNLRYTIQT